MQGMPTFDEIVRLSKAEEFEDAVRTTFPMVQSGTVFTFVCAIRKGLSRMNSKKRMGFILAGIISYAGALLLCLSSVAALPRSPSEARAYASRLYIATIPPSATNMNIAIGRNTPLISNPTVHSSAPQFLQFEASSSYQPKRRMVRQNLHCLEFGFISSASERERGKSEPTNDPREER